MRTALIAASAACVMLAAPALAHAEVNWYADAGYTNVNVDDPDVNLGVVQGRVGFRITPYFGLEGEAAFGAKSDSVGAGNVNVDVEMKHIFGGYFVLNWPVNDKLDVWVRAGRADMEVKASAGGFSAAESGGASAVGLGAAYYFAGKNGVRGDWTNYGGADAFSIAYIRKF